MSRLAQEKKAINLGQGFPEGCEPRAIVERAAWALMNESNQYPPMMGLPVLRQAVAAHDRDFYGMDLDWQSETLIVSGLLEGEEDEVAAAFAPLRERRRLRLQGWSALLLTRP